MLVFGRCLTSDTMLRKHRRVMCYGVYYVWDQTPPWSKIHNVLFLVAAYLAALGTSLVSLACIWFHLVTIFLGCPSGPYWVHSSSFAAGILAAGTLTAPLMTATLWTFAASPYLTSHFLALWSWTRASLTSPFLASWSTAGSSVLTGRFSWQVKLF